MIPSLNFDLGETVAMLRDTVMSFASEEIAPLAEEIDRTDSFPRQLWAARRAMESSGSSTKCVVPSRYGLLNW